MFFVIQKYVPTTAEDDIYLVLFAMFITLRIFQIPQSFIRSQGSPKACPHIFIPFPFFPFSFTSNTPSLCPRESVLLPTSSRLLSFPFHDSPSNHANTHLLYEREYPLLACHKPFSILPFPFFPFLFSPPLRHSNIPPCLHPHPPHLHSLLMFSPLFPSRHSHTL